MKTLILAALILASASAFADRDSYVDGYKQGYKAEMGRYAIAPIAPFTAGPENSYSGGLKAGFEQGQSENRHQYSETIHDEIQRELWQGYQ